MSDYPNLDLTGQTQASTYRRLTQITSSSPGLFDLVDGLGNKVLQLNLTSSFSISSSITNITQSNSSASLFSVSASWASSSLTSISSINSLTASYVSSSGTVTIQSGNNIAEFRNSSSAQTVRIYGSGSTTNSFPRLAIYGSGNDMVIESQPQGFASSSGDLIIRHTGNHSLKFYTSGSQRWSMASSGDWLPSSTNINIGQAGQGVNNLWVTNIIGSSITGSLNGTSSWANNVVSASYANTSSRLNFQLGLLQVIHPTDTTNTAVYIDATDNTTGGKILIRGDDSFSTGQTGIISFSEVDDFTDATIKGGHSGIGDPNSSYLQIGVGTTNNALSIIATSITSSIPIVAPNFIGTASLALTSSYITSSNIKGNVFTASLALNTISSSYSTTASFLNSYSPYNTINTSSTNWVTISYSAGDQYVSITSGQAYNFTCSNVPLTGQSANVSLYIDNSAAATSSLSFPSNWIFLGSAPTSITASKSAVLSLKAFGPNKLVAAYGFQQ